MMHCRWCGWNVLNLDGHGDDHLLWARREDELKPCAVKALEYRRTQSELQNAKEAMKDVIL